MIPVPQPTFTRRLKASTSSGKPPLLLVCFSTEDVATQVLSRARNLRSSESEHIRSNVFINRDLTKAEAAAAFELRKQRRDREHNKVQLTQANIVVDHSSPISSESGSNTSVIDPSCVPPPSVLTTGGQIPANANTHSVDSVPPVASSSSSTDAPPGMHITSSS